MNYGGDPSNTPEEEFKQMIKNWSGYEAAATELMFITGLSGVKRNNHEKRLDFIEIDKNSIPYYYCQF